MKFEISTEIWIEIYAPHPDRQTDGTIDLRATYAPGELPPFVGTGIKFNENGRPDVIIINDFDAPYPVKAREVIYTAHRVRVGNLVGQPGVNPCLEAAPIITESLPNLYNGIPDFSTISFTLLDPNLKRWFSSDFVSTQGLVQVFRVVNGVRTQVWQGLINAIVFGEVQTRISARPDSKKLDEKATFGFDDKLLEWRSNGAEVPIISAQLIPYSTLSENLSSRYVKTYPEWFNDLVDYGDLFKDLRDYRGESGLSNASELTEEEKNDHIRHLVEHIEKNQQPRYITFDQANLVKTIGYPITKRSGDSKVSSSLTITRDNTPFSVPAGVTGMTHDGENLITLTGVVLNFYDIDNYESIDSIRLSQLPSQVLDQSNAKFTNLVFANNSFFVLYVHLFAAGSLSGRRNLLSQWSNLGQRRSAQEFRSASQEIDLGPAGDYEEYTGIDYSGDYWYLLNASTKRVIIKDRHGIDVDSIQLERDPDFTDIKLIFQFLCVLNNSRNRLEFWDLRTKTLIARSSYGLPSGNWTSLTYFENKIYVFDATSNSIERFSVEQVFTNAPDQEFELGADVGFWLNIDRGIFILPSEEATPAVNLDLDEKNFRESLIPVYSRDHNPYPLTFYNDPITPYAINSNQDFMNWHMINLGITSSGGPEDRYFVDAKGVRGGEEGNLRIPQPFDSFYIHTTQEKRYLHYLLFQIHNGIVFSHIRKRDPFAILNRSYGYWSSIARSLRLPSKDNALTNQGLANFYANIYEQRLLFSRQVEHTYRSKDLYTTGGSFPESQRAARSNDRDLLIRDTEAFVNEFSLDGQFEPSPYVSGAGTLIKCLPNIHTRPDKENKLFRSPQLFYERSRYLGGAYYVSAVYPISNQIVTKESAEGYGDPSYKDFGHIMNQPHRIMFSEPSNDVNWDGQNFGKSLGVYDDPINNVRRYYILEDLPETTSILCFNENGGRLPIRDIVFRPAFTHSPSSSLFRPLLTCFEMVGGLIFGLAGVEEIDHRDGIMGRIYVYTLDGNRNTSHILDGKPLYRPRDRFYDLSISRDITGDSKYIREFEFKGITIDAPNRRIFTCFNFIRVSKTPTAPIREQADNYLNGITIHSYDPVGAVSTTGGYVWHRKFKVADPVTRTFVRNVFPDGLITKDLLDFEDGSQINIDRTSLRSVRQQYQPTTDFTTGRGYFVVYESVQNFLAFYEISGKERAELRLFLRSGNYNYIKFVGNRIAMLRRSGYIGFWNFEGQWQRDEQVILPNIPNGGYVQFDATETRIIAITYEPARRGSVNYIKKLKFFNRSGNEISEEELVFDSEGRTDNQVRGFFVNNDGNYVFLLADIRGRSVSTFQSVINPSNQRIEIYSPALEKLHTIPVVSHGGVGGFGVTESSDHYIVHHRTYSFRSYLQYQTNFRVRTYVQGSRFFTIYRKPQ